MKKHTLFVLTLATVSLQAQTNIHQISTGTGYAKFGYYQLSDGATQQVNNDAWDIAFGNLGPASAGIFVNESTHSVQGQAQPGVEVFDTGIFDFSQTIDQGSLTAELRLYNPETSWHEGAFNTVKDPSDPFDLGWGSYDPVTHQVDGIRVFAVKLRNGQYKKLLFESYDGQTYIFKAADLNGANEQTYTINKNAGNGSPVVYFSFANANPTTPTAWDLVFCRYSTLLFDGQEYIQYGVAGILSNDGVQTAKAVGVDPATVDYQLYLDSLNSRPDIIGHDWKSFSGTAWEVSSDHAYFAKAKDGKLYKIVFIDFEGSSTGTATLERTYITQLSATNDLPAGITEAAVFPNPVADHLTVSFTATSAVEATFNIVNIQGQMVWSGNTRTQQGLNVFEINQLPSLATGTYLLNMQLPSGQFSRQIVVD